MSNRNKERGIFVGNLPPDIRDNDIKSLFGKFGEITFIDLKDQRVSPFAFIEYSNAMDAEDALNARDGFDYNSYRLRVEFRRASKQDRSEFRGRGQPARRSEFKCFVTGLPPSGSWQDLKDHMRKAGDVYCANVYKDGTGMVEFSCFEDMKFAVRELDDSKFISHENETSYIRVKEGSKGRSRSRSFSPSRRTSPRRTSPRRTFPSPRRTFSSPRRTFPSPRRTFSSPRRSFSSPRRSFSPPRQAPAPIYPPEGLYYPF